MQNKLLKAGLILMVLSMLAGLIGFLQWVHVVDTYWFTVQFQEAGWFLERLSFVLFFIWFIKVYA